VRFAARASFKAPNPKINDHFIFQVIEFHLKKWREVFQGERLATCSTREVRLL
jgi:hypothetical protein